MARDQAAVVCTRRAPNARASALADDAERLPELPVDGRSRDGLDRGRNQLSGRCRPQGLVTRCRCPTFGARTHPAAPDRGNRAAGEGDARGCRSDRPSRRAAGLRRRGRFSGRDPGIGCHQSGAGFGHHGNLVPSDPPGPAPCPTSRGDECRDRDGRLGCLCGRGCRGRCRPLGGANAGPRQPQL